MTEFELIGKIAAGLPGNAEVVQGAGDDCALLDLGLGDRWVVFKADATGQGVHFTAETPARKAGRKALARALSDIAAAAGTPAACLVTIGLPKDFDPDWVLEFYEGLNELAREHGVAVAGGETSRIEGKFFASVAVLGTVPKGWKFSRANARAGDAIFVSGELGGAMEGKHLDFEPRLAEARWLAAHFPIHAMMDLSDGLAGDLRHILQASRVGAELLGEAVPVSRAAKLRAKAGSSAKPALLAALSDGEDFELLFTAPAKQAVALMDGWREKFPKTKISCIGKITEKPGLKLRDKLGSRELGAHGYTHFS